MESFLGFCNYYRSYIKDFAIYTAKLEKAYKKKDQTLNWDEEKKDAFNALKELVNSDIATYLPNFQE